MIVERARQLRNQIELLAETLDNTTALEVAELFSTWKDNTTYETGTRIRFEDVLYKCLQSHTSQSSWTPDVAPSLWAKVLIPGDEIPEWEQPESTNPYMKDDKVTHNGKTWISIIDNNVWEPGVYGWDEYNE